MDQALKQEEIPSGGIADFIYSDEEIKLLEEKELQDLYGQNGIAQFKAIGKEMANFGRYGDDTVAHVETGELIVPRALIENNPKLKESIFGHLRELGVEDPERYVVGTSKNSLNPDTGLPEFFLKKLFKGAKKAVSSVAKGVSSALKGVGKALKKVAPIVVPIALNYFLPGLGQIYSGALGAGITSLLQGGSVKDALKSAFVGGATGAISAGFSGPKSGIDGFGQNIASDFRGGSANIRQAFSEGSFKPLTSTNLPSLRDLASQDVKPTSDITSVDTTPGNIPKVSSDPYLARGRPDGVKPIITDAGVSPDLYSNKLAGAQKTDFGFQPNRVYGGNLELNTRMDGSPSFMDQFRAEPAKFGFDTTGAPKGPATVYDQLKSGVSKASDFMFGAKPTDQAINEYASKLVQDYPDLYGPSVKGGAKAALEKANEVLGPGFLQKYGPSTALGIAALSGAGAFKTPEDKPLPQLRSGFDLYREDPDKFNVGDINVRTAQAPLSTQTSYGFNYNPYVFPTQPFQAAAEGGEIFPRRNGGISPREGTPGKDSVRAMLMPGEFVMTTDAVKGLGGGNLDKGIKNMYSVMSKLEKRGKAMA
jgi:hypothetical protein